MRKLINQELQCQNCHATISTYATAKGFLTECPNGCFRIFHMNQNSIPTSLCQHNPIIKTIKNNAKMIRCPLCRYTKFIYKNTENLYPEKRIISEPTSQNAPKIVKTAPNQPLKSVAHTFTLPHYIHAHPISTEKPLVQYSPAILKSEPKPDPPPTNWRNDLRELIRLGVLGYIAYAAYIDLTTPQPPSKSKNPTNRDTK